MFKSKRVINLEKQVIDLEKQVEVLEKQLAKSNQKEGGLSKGNRTDVNLVEENQTLKDFIKYEYYRSREKLRERLEDRDDLDFDDRKEMFDNLKNYYNPEKGKEYVSKALMEYEQEDKEFSQVLESIDRMEKGIER